MTADATLLRAARRRGFLIGAFVTALWEQVRQDNVLIRASGLAYASLVAFVPFVVVLVALFTAFAAFDDLAVKLQQTLLTQFVPSYQDEIIAFLGEASTGARRLGFPGFLLLIVTSILLLDAVEVAFNDIWHVRSRRRLVSKITAYTSVLVLSTLFVGASLTITARLQAVTFGAWRLPLSLPAAIGSRPFALLLTFAAFLVMYVVIPFARVRVRSAVLGAGVAAVLWEFAKHAFASSVGSSVRTSILYGSLAAVPIFLVWLYVTWVVVLLGLEIAFTHQRFHALVRGRATDRGSASRTVLLALQVLALAGERFAQAGEPPSIDELAERFEASPQEVDSVLQRLATAGLLRQTGNGAGDGWVPARPLEQIELSDAMSSVFGETVAAREKPASLERKAAEQLHRYQRAGAAALEGVTLARLLADRARPTRPPRTS